jgi:hypothetical protein
MGFVSQGGGHWFLVGRPLLIIFVVRRKVVVIIVGERRAKRARTRNQAIVSQVEGQEGNQDVGKRAHSYGRPPLLGQHTDISSR